MNSKPFKLIIKPVLAIALIAWVAACNNGSASSTTPATTAYDWQQTFNSDSNSLFNSLSQDSLGNVYSVYLANGDSSTGFGNLVVMKYNSSINQFQQVFNSGDLVSTPLTQFDSLNRLYASYITPAGDVSYVRLNQNGSLSTQGTLLRNAIKKTSLTQATPLSNESFKKLQAQGYSAIPVTLVSPVTPDWYGINSYSFKINDDKMYVAYNNGTNAEAKVCDLNGQCSVPQTLTNESTEQSYFAELGFAPDHSALVVFNEAPNPRGIMKLYNQASESWNQVCADLPLNGKAVSAPLVYNTSLSPRICPDTDS